MAGPAPPLGASLRAAVDRLADLTVPAPVSWLPQTWGWAALASVLALLAGWAAWRALRRHAADRYRREALLELARLEAGLQDGALRGAALAGMAALVKRVALAAWPRAQVASLSGAAWVEFLHANGGAPGLPIEAARFLDDREYRALPAMDIEGGRRLARAVRGWIVGHRVSA